MSTENKKKVLLGFGAFAVVLIAVLAIWRPPAFRSEDASGSIGAVQKHHAPQITQKDVILGDETTKHDQQIRYTDFLDDAAKLHALSAMISANKFDAAAAEIAAMRAEAQQRYNAAANESLEAAKALARSENQKMDAEIEGLSAILQSGHLSDADMANFNTKLEALSQRLAVKSAAERANAAKSQVDAALAEMRTNNASAAAKVASAAGDLKAMNAITLADRGDYLKATEVESKALDRAQAGMMGLPMARVLSANADALEMRAAKAMDRQLGLLVVICSTVRDIDANITAARGVAEASVAGRSQAYDKALLSASQTFAGATAEVNAQATAGVNTQLAALNAYTAARSGSRAPALDAVLANLSQQIAGNSALGASLEQRGALAMRAQEMVNQKTAARN